EDGLQTWTSVTDPVEVVFNSHLGVIERTPQSSKEGEETRRKDLDEEATEDKPPTSTGQLAAGDEINIYDPRNAGFLMQYFAVGVIYGGLPGTVYGFFLGYLNVPGYVYATAGVVTTLPWSFKFFFGLMNDCLPVNGYSRKPYMVFGWALCCATLVVLNRVGLPDPYWCVGADGNYLKHQEPCNPSAASAGGEYAMLMCLAALGYVIADVAADGLMVQYAQREPQERRGTIGSTALIAFCMNGKLYNGTFDWSLSFNDVMGIFAVPAGLMVPLSWFLVVEEKVQPGERKSLRSYLKEVWGLITSKAFFFVIMFQFWEPFVGRISTPAGGLVKSEWAGVKNLQNQLFSLVALFVFSFGLWQVKKHFLNTSWRMMLLGTSVLINVMDATLAFLTIFDVVRNQYFYLGESILDEIPAAANFVIGTFIVVEMADKGNEGLTYGLMTTVANLGTPFARAVGNQIFGLFPANLSDAANYVADTQDFRQTVATSFAVSYLFSFLSLIFLFLLLTCKM
ncbi:unnamed protein product, partial [Polarella glacialis]